MESTNASAPAPSPSPYRTALRTHTLGDLRASDAGAKVVLTGWLDRRRDHAGALFLDLRDRYGKTQVIADPKERPDAHAVASTLRAEDVVRVEGEVRLRPEGYRNSKIATGEIEVVASKVDVITRCELLPFEVTAQAAEADEQLRLKHRTLDLRREAMQQRMLFRHRLIRAVRQEMDARGFVDVETPILTRSTPEGARDYIVPSRVAPGTFYALPQSPQLFKQLLMVAGYDRYYQIARCFRDEDLRADRQPEFTQLDVEMSFVDQPDVWEVIEGVIARVFQETLGIAVARPFRRIPHREALLRYGSDKPDLRYGLEIVDVTPIARKLEFRVLRDAADAPGGAVRGIRVPGGAAKLSRKDVDELGPHLARELKAQAAKGVLPLKLEASGELVSPLKKHLGDALRAELLAAFGAAPGDLVLIVADPSANVVAASLGELRRELARRLGLAEKGRFELVWVIDFPLFEADPDRQGGVQAAHHPFTSPYPQDVPLIESRPLEVRARCYDLVLNGTELGSGSIRIHDGAVQEAVFRVLGVDHERARSRFGFLLDAFKYGAPPHGGFAVGLDRLVSILSGAGSIRDVVAFPKTHRGACLMTGAPSVVDPGQLGDLGIAIVAPPPPPNDAPKS